MKLFSFDEKYNTSLALEDVYPKVEVQPHAPALALHSGTCRQLAFLDFDLFRNTPCVAADRGRPARARGKGRKSRVLRAWGSVSGGAPRLRLPRLAALPSLRRSSILLGRRLLAREAARLKPVSPAYAPQEMTVKLLRQHGPDRGVKARPPAALFGDATAFSQASDARSPSQPAAAVSLMLPTLTQVVIEPAVSFIEPVLSALSIDVLPSLLARAPSTQPPAPCAQLLLLQLLPSDGKWPKTRRSALLPQIVDAIEVAAQRRPQFSASTPALLTQLYSRQAR